MSAVSVYCLIVLVLLGVYLFYRFSRACDRDSKVSPAKEEPAPAVKPEEAAPAAKPAPVSVEAQPTDVGSEEATEYAEMMRQARRDYALLERKRRKEWKLERERQDAWMKAGTMISAETWAEAPRMFPTIIVTELADLRALASDGVDLDETEQAMEIVVYNRGKVFPLHRNESADPR
jgi:hypothetical protein